MRAITKQQLARRAEVSMTTLCRWLKSIEHKLTPLGYTRTMRVLPPNIAKVIIEHFCIDITDENNL